MSEHYPKVGDIVNIMEDWAPAWLAEPWDNVGLLAGSEKARVKEAWIALEASSKLLAQAAARPNRMLLLHHPPIFKPLKNLKTTQPTQAALIKAAAGGLNIFAAHTNLDAAKGGVNHALADRLGLNGLQPLLSQPEGELLKLVVFCPTADSEKLSRALFAAGAGQMGNYQDCAFSLEGQGQFRPMAGACPSLGRIGQLTKVAETRLEVLLPKARLNQALNALLRHHPYEEPAFDIIPLLNHSAGLGLVGNLTKSVPGKTFLSQAGQSLSCGQPRYAGKVPRQVNRVAVLGGSGAEGLAAAAALGAQVFITGEAGYHTAALAEDLNICLLLLGHYATEVVIVKPWALKLQAALKQAGLTCAVHTPPTQDLWRSL